MFKGMVYMQCTMIQAIIIEKYQKCFFTTKGGATITTKNGGIFGQISILFFYSWTELVDLNNVTQLV